MKCKVCNKELIDCHGAEIFDNVFVCNTTDCAEFAIGVVEAARAVVALNYDTLTWSPSGLRRCKETIEKLREALAE